MMKWMVKGGWCGNEGVEGKAIKEECSEGGWGSEVV